MAATKPVSQPPRFRKSAETVNTPQPADDVPERLIPRHGVVTLFGYGISIRVERGHLVLQDGIGPARREARFPRVGHGLKRLVVIGADGFVSLSALKWLAGDQ